jgi:hypothetical protein
MQEHTLQNSCDFVLLDEREITSLTSTLLVRTGLVFLVVRQVVHVCSAVFVANFCTICII